jgi:hypothetical protein
MKLRSAQDRGDGARAACATSHSEHRRR